MTGGGARAPLVADSWRVDEGRVRRLDAHRARFDAACLAGPVPPEPAALDAFWARVLDRLPRRGSWFPRATLSALGALGLELRSTPPPDPAPGAVSVLTLPDPRRRPRVKGPDLPALAELLRATRARGADDGLLCNPDGLVLEGVFSSVLWWEGDALCTPDPVLPVLPGTTRDWLCGLARDRGVAVRHRRVRAAELRGHETWLVNARTGIRPVAAWAGPGVTCPAAPAARAEAWHRLWLDSARPLP